MKKLIMAEENRNKLGGALMVILIVFILGVIAGFAMKIVGIRSEYVAVNADACMHNANFGPWECIKIPGQDATDGPCDCVSRWPF